MYLWKENEQNMWVEWNMEWRHYGSQPSRCPPTIHASGIHALVQSPPTVNKEDLGDQQNSAKVKVCDFPISDIATSALLSQIAHSEK